MSAREDGLEYGPLWERLFAFAIDCIALRIVHHVITLPYMPILVFLALRVSTSGFELRTAIPFILLESTLVITLTAVTVLYFVVTESSRYQATIGKYVFDLKVTVAAGRRISPSRALLRTFGKLVTLATVGIGFVAGRFSRTRQTLHDKIASTYVVKAVQTSSTE